MERREAIQRTALIMGTALTPGIATAILGGCSPKIELNWKPQFLSEEEAFLAGQIADRIIPRTDTPGALDVGVDQYIDKMLLDVYSEEDGNAFKEGIKRLNSSSKDTFGKIFTKLSPEEMDSMLQKFESERDRIFQISKELTLIGYFTSEEGIKSNFVYRPIPGKYEDCVDYKSGDKVWIGNHVFNV